MNKDQIAIYLNEHPEFFNDYPELLHKIKQVDDSDLPIEPLKTLSIADRILKRANDDKEHMRSQLEWFVEITQANEAIQGHLFEIERAILSNIDLTEMILQLKGEILNRFEINRVMICLSDNLEHFIEDELPGREDLEGTLRLVAQDTLGGWFPEANKPTLNSELSQGSDIFPKEEEIVQSEALVPILIRGQVAGAICLGSTKPLHFYDGLRTDYLERMAEKLGLAIDNILLLERLRRQPVLDKLTGLYNASYLDPVLEREFDRAKRYEKPLSTIKMWVDSSGDSDDTDNNSRQQKIFKEVGRILADSSRGGDSVIRTGTNEFLMLLPGLDKRAAVHVAERIRAALESFVFPDEEGVSLECRLGVSGYVPESMQLPSDLIHSATRALSQARENGHHVVSV